MPQQSQQEPFCWPDPIDERNPRRGVFHGNDSSRQEAIEQLLDLFSNPIRQAYVGGPHGIGKTSTVIYAIRQQWPDENVALLEIKIQSLDESDVIRGIREYISEYYKNKCEERVRGKELIDALELCSTKSLRTALRVISERQGFIPMKNPHDALGKFLYSLKLTSLTHLVYACRARTLEEMLVHFKEWIHDQKPQPIVLFYGNFSVNLAKIREIQKHFGNVLCIFESSWGDAEELGKVEIYALDTSEALNCILGKKAHLPIRRPRFTKSRNIAQALLQHTGTLPFLIQAVCFDLDQRWNHLNIKNKRHLDTHLDRIKNAESIVISIEKWWASLPDEVHQQASGLLSRLANPRSVQVLEQVGLIYRFRNQVYVPKLIQDWWDTRQGPITQDQRENDNVLRQLQEAIQRGSVLPFIGNGCSIPLGYPSWKELVQELLDRAGYKDKKFTDPLIAVEECKKELGGNCYNRYLKSTFKPRKPYYTKEHELIWKLFPHQLLTTNFDPCLEYAYKDLYKCQPRSLSNEDKKGVGAFPRQVNSRSQDIVFHIHGYYKNPKNLILTDSDYRKYYLNTPYFRNTLSALFQAHTIVFIGFGLKDHDLLYLLREQKAIFEESELCHFAIMPYPDDPRDIPKTREDFQRLNIKLIFYMPEGKDHFNPRLRLLEKLRGATNANSH